MKNLVIFFTCVVWCGWETGFSELLPTSCPNITSKLDWGGRTALQIEYAVIPVQYAIIQHTVTEQCQDVPSCASIVMNIQDYHMDALDYYDIGYNFLVGGDGGIYEGVGWNKVGAHAVGYNSLSLGLAFIGNFEKHMPNEEQLKAAQKLLECGVNLGALDTDYKLLGAKQVISTLSPGKYLYDKIRKWPHYARRP